MGTSAIRMVVIILLVVVMGCALAGPAYCQYVYGGQLVSAITNKSVYFANEIISVYVTVENTGNIVWYWPSTDPSWKWSVAPSWSPGTKYWDNAHIEAVQPGTRSSGMITSLPAPVVGSYTLAVDAGYNAQYPSYYTMSGSPKTIPITVIPPDTQPPTGTISINGGAAYTTSTSVTLTLSATDATSGVYQMRFSNDNSTWSAWESYDTTKNWTLTSGEGTKTVCVQFKDNAGNQSGSFSDGIVLDTTPPTGSVLINGGTAYTISTSVSLTLSATIGAYEMRFSNDDWTWSEWTSYAATKSWTLTSGDGTKTVYAQFKYKAGDQSFSDGIVLDTTAPTGSVVINGGAGSTNSTYVTLTLSATDATSGVYQMRFSNDNSTWSAWESYATTKSWTLTPGEGTRTVYVRYKDSAGNQSGSFSEGIVLKTPPDISPDPVSQTAAAGQTVTFAVGVTGNPTPTLHWEYSANNGTTWDDIPSAIGLSYTTPPTTHFDNGKQFRCVAANSVGSHTSEPATVGIPYGVRLSDLSHSPTPPNPIRVWGKVTSESPLKISDGRAEITVNGLTASLGDYLVVTGNWIDNVLTGVMRYVGPVGAEMIYIPVGSFLMGNSGVGDDATYASAYPNELPQHSVTLSGYYYIGKYEVTRGEYRQFMNAGGYSTQSYWSTAGWTWKGNRTEPEYWAANQNWYGGQPVTQTDNHPVVGVTYYEAEAFCNWAGGHLPAEAQWERAARWTGAHANVYPWGDVWDAQKCNNWYDSLYPGHQAAPVGSYSSYPSPSGCQDMAGNVWEWCKDWYGDAYYSQSLTSDPQGPASGSYRVMRGGSWNNPVNYYRCASRSYYYPYNSSMHLGFRLAR